ncbi:TolC family protein [Desulfitobacterium sp. AusDCA]|uniref:TolC family protein n=1 Tax=Desulfitobacterium sp. AusDCA TaxID=3240383 RepID=UPI003DA6EA87
MKKVLAILLSVSMLACSAPPVMAADDSLDIEKVAIATLKNSQTLQNVDNQVSLVNKNYGNVTEAINKLRAALVYPSMSYYQNVVTIIEMPLEMQDRVNQAINGQQVATNGVRLSSYQAYQQLLKAKYAMDIKQELMLSLETDYKNAQLELEQGTISSPELRLSEITYLKAQYDYHSAQNSYDSATQSVNQLMGEKLPTRYSTLKDDNIVPAATIKPLEDYISAALGSRVEIINARNTLDLKKKEYDLGKSEIPTDYDFYVQKQEYAIGSAENDLSLAKISVQEDITNSYKILEAAMKSLEAKKAMADQAALNYQAAKAEYENSQITLQDLGKVKNDKAQKDIDYKNAQLDAWLAQISLEAACGIGYQPPNATSSTDFSISPYPSQNNVNPVETRD